MRHTHTDSALCGRHIQQGQGKSSQVGSAAKSAEVTGAAVCPH